MEKGIQFQQNNLFKNNQSQLYKELGGAEADRNNLAPDAREATRFWGSIWSEPGKHGRETAWLKRVKRWLARVEKQEDVRVTTEDVVAGVRRMSNWKAPGPDGVQEILLPTPGHGEGAADVFRRGECTGVDG